MYVIRVFQYTPTTLGVGVGVYRIHSTHTCALFGCRCECVSNSNSIHTASLGVVSVYRILIQYTLTCTSLGVGVSVYLILMFNTYTNTHLEGVFVCVTFALLYYCWLGDKRSRIPQSNF